MYVQTLRFSRDFALYSNSHKLPGSHNALKYCQTLDIIRKQLTVTFFIKVCRYRSLVFESKEIDSIVTWIQKP